MVKCKILKKKMTPVDLDRVSITHTICRICLKEKCPDCVEASVNSEWAELFQFCIGKSVGGHENEAPRVFCGSCATLLKQFAEFKELCLKYDYFWDNIKYQPVSSEYDIDDNSEVKVECEEEFLVEDDFNFDDSQSTSVFDIEDIKREDSEKKEIIELKVKNEDLNVNKPTTPSNESKNKVTDDFISKHNTKERFITRSGWKLKTQSDANRSEKNEVSADSILKHNTKEQVVTRRGRKLKTQSDANGSKNEISEDSILKHYPKKQVKTRRGRKLKTQSDAIKNKIYEDFISKHYTKEQVVTRRGLIPRYTCHECGVVINIKCKLGYHKKRCHKLKKEEEAKQGIVQNELHYCGICDFKSEDEKVVHAHFNQHCDDKQLNCGLCDYVGLDAAHMVSHRVKHFPDSDVCVRCPKCPSKTDKIYRLEYHYRSEHLKKIGGFCAVCQKNVLDIRNYEHHMLKHDGRTPEFICDICGCKFSKRRFIVRHIEEVHFKKKNAMKHLLCQYCGQGFAKKYDLASHIFNRHTESKSVHCDQCDRTFKNEVTFSKHQWRLHMENKFKCDFCPKLFPSLKAMHSHMFWHDKDNRPFSCSYCEKTYKANSALKIHMLTHTGASPYVCDICHQKLSSSMSLKRHKQVIHSGLKPFKCPYCQCRFIEKKRVVNHCNRKHKDLPNPVNTFIDSQKEGTF